MRGGHGLTGRFRHKKSAVIRGLLPPIGKKGFSPIRPKKDIPINVGNVADSLADLTVKGAVSERSGKTVVDLTKLGYTKLLGEGRLTKPITIIVQSTSESAKRKVEEAGGAVELPAKTKA